VISVFLDTNVILYSILDQDPHKTRIADEILSEQDCHISVQSLNETLNTLRRKTALSFDTIADLLSDIRRLVTVHDLTGAVFSRGLAIVKRYGLQTYDAIILGSAIEHGFETVLSEDMQDGLKVFDMLTVLNPFTMQRAS